MWVCYNNRMNLKFKTKYYMVKSTHQKMSKVHTILHDLKHATKIQQVTVVNWTKKVDTI